MNSPMTMTMIDCIEEALRDAVLTAKRSAGSEPHNVALTALYQARELLDDMLGYCETMAAEERSQR